MVSVPGVYGGFLDNFPFGAAFSKGLTFKMGQTNVHAYLPALLKLIVDGKIDLRFPITHRLRLDQAPEGYAMFNEKSRNCIKIVLTP